MMIEYAILIVMVIFTIGFAWLWFIEQKKKGKRKEALSKRRSSDGAQAGFEGRCACRQNILIQRDPHRRVSSHDELGRNRP
jgi:hypothetical protein